MGPDPGRPAIFGNAGWRGIGAGKRGAFALEPMDAHIFDLEIADRTNH